MSKKKEDKKLTKDQAEKKIQTLKTRTTQQGWRISLLRWVRHLFIIPAELSAVDFPS